MVIMFHYIIDWFVSLLLHLQSDNREICGFDPRRLFVLRGEPCKCAKTPAYRKEPQSHDNEEEPNLRLLILGMVETSVVIIIAVCRNMYLTSTRRCLSCSQGVSA